VIALKLYTTTSIQARGEKDSKFPEKLILIALISNILSAKRTLCREKLINR